MSDIIAVHCLPDGEEFKNFQTLNTIFDALAAARLHRDGAIVALGGGVVGDVAGFAAACYQRGIACLQVPTTCSRRSIPLSVARRGINHSAGKNLIGAFHQPVARSDGHRYAAHAAARELRAGLAEVIKYGLDRGPPISASGSRLTSTSCLLVTPAALEHAIRRSCEIKAGYRCRRRARSKASERLLNLGHTFGHAIESADRLSHLAARRGRRRRPVDGCRAVGAAADGWMVRMCNACDRCWNAPACQPRRSASM